MSYDSRPWPPSPTSANVRAKPHESVVLSMFRRFSSHTTHSYAYRRFVAVGRTGLVGASGGGQATVNEIETGAHNATGVVRLYAFISYLSYAAIRPNNIAIDGRRQSFAARLGKSLSKHPLHIGAVSVSRRASIVNTNASRVGFFAGRMVTVG